MGNKSAMRGLPAKLLQEIDRQLAKGTITIAQIKEKIASFEGVERVPSESAIGRYRKDFDDTAKSLREAREFARGLAMELGPEALESDQGRMLVEILRTLAFKVLRNKDSITEKEFASFCRGIKDLAQTMHLELGFIDKIKASARQAALQEAVETVQATASAQGLTQAAVDVIKTQILGIRQ